MDTDDDVAALARMIRARARRLERDAFELRGLTTKLLDTIAESDTTLEEDTDARSRNGRHETPAPV